MSKSIYFLIMSGFIALTSACSSTPKYEYTTIEPEPISVEPAFTGKYK